MRSPPDRASARADVVRAIEILYDVGERDLIAGGLAELGERSRDVATLAAVGEVAARHQDARAMALLGKAALGRGLPLEHFAFPTVGIPRYRAIGPEVEPGIVYAVARQESSFKPRAISSARAVGLMQMTPAAGQSVANKFGLRYDEKRLLNDETYNVQLGAAELGDLIKYYRGSYILSFAGYNAGRGRVKDWITMIAHMPFARSSGGARIMSLDASSYSKVAAGLPTSTSIFGFGPRVQRMSDVGRFVPLGPFRCRRSP